jgi:formylmethanofuran dehydrogenase subunit C
LQQLGGNWVNTDGSTVSIGFVADNGQVALTGDTGTYINQNGGTVIVS